MSGRERVVQGPDPRGLPKLIKKRAGELRAELFPEERHSIRLAKPLRDDENPTPVPGIVDQLPRSNEKFVESIRESAYRLPNVANVAYAFAEEDALPGALPARKGEHYMSVHRVGINVVAHRQQRLPDLG